MNKKSASGQKIKWWWDPEVKSEVLENFKLYQFPNVFKSIAFDQKETKFLSEKGLWWVKEMQTYSIPEDLLYKIDKIVREKLKEESIRFTKLDT